MRHRGVWPDERDNALPGVGHDAARGVIGGVLGSTIGVRETLIVAAAGGSLAFLPVFLSPLRRMRELPCYEGSGQSADVA